jgi:hypothetical protein
MALSIEMQSGDVILIAADEILLPQYQPGSDCSRYPILNVPIPSRWAAHGISRIL